MAVFLVNSRLGLLSAAHILLQTEPHFSRSYVRILPSSLTRGRSCALDYSSFLPVSVSGTVPAAMSLDVISRHCAPPASPHRSAAPFTARLALRISLQASSAHRLDRDYRRPACSRALRHALSGSGSGGMFTPFPSATPFGLALGAAFPGADCLHPGDLRFSADGDRTRLFVTYACILSSASSRTPRGCPFVGQRNAPLPVASFRCESAASV